MLTPGEGESNWKILVGEIDVNKKETWADYQSLSNDCTREKLVKSNQKCHFHKEY